MQVTCRRCGAAFPDVGGPMTPCPRCGSVDRASLSPMAATAERRAPEGFSGPVSEPPGTGQRSPAAMTGVMSMNDPATSHATIPLATAPQPPVTSQVAAPMQPQPYAPMQPYPQQPPPAGYGPPGYAAMQPYPQQPGYMTPPGYGPPPQQQPMQIVIHNQIAPTYVPVPMQMPVQYAMAPYTRRKDPAVATLLSFFLPGFGQLYNGQIGKGVGFILLSMFVNFPLMFIGVGFFTALATWVWGMIDAHSTAEKINRGEIVV